ncbi:unnamed protein product, partial [Hapterophycus canaliculatus]
QSQRALLESLRRHVQRGHHAAPSFTAFQLIEQIFECLKSLESDAELPFTPPSRETQRRRPSPAAAGRSSPSSALGFPPPPPPPRRPRSPTTGTGPPAPMTEGQPSPPPSGRSGREDNSGDAVGNLRRAGIGQGRAGGEWVEGFPSGAGSVGGVESFAFSSGGSGSSDGSQEKFYHHGGGGGVAGEGRGERGTTASSARFSTEWAYRLAVTKLTAQLRAARERLRGEKEASREAGERVEQEELRCRQLELEVEGLSSKVAAAEGHRRRLEAMLKEAKRERDVLKQRQGSTAATHALTAALGVLHQRRSPSTPQPYARAPPPPPPPPAAAIRPTATAPHATPAASAAVQTAGAPAETASEALNCGRGKGLEPSALAPAYSGGGGSAWWDGDEKTEDQRHRYSRPTTGEHTPVSPAPFATAARVAPVYADRQEEAEPRFSHGLDAAYGGNEGNPGSMKRDARSEIQRIVDDAVANGTRRQAGVAGIGG